MNELRFHEKNWDEIVSIEMKLHSVRYDCIGKDDKCIANGVSK